MTGNPPFPPWLNASLKSARLENQIEIHPWYGLMPEASGPDIARCAVAVLELLADGSIRRALMDKFPQMDLPESTRFLCSATSAGAFLAIRFVSHAERLRAMITALVLVSPMLEVYTRALGHPYGQHILTDEEHKEWGVNMFLEGARLRQHGNVVLGRTPPDRMGIYPFTTVGCKISFNKGLVAPRSLWGVMCGTHSAEEYLEEMLLQTRRDSDIPRKQGSPPIEIDAGELADNLGREGMEAFGLEYSPKDNALVQRTTETLPETPSTWPPTFVAHGDADTNCPIEGVERFIGLLKKLYPETKVWLYKSDGMGHAYDYKFPDKLSDLTRHVRQQQLQQ